MMKRCFVFAALLFFPVSAMARQLAFGYCQNGGQTVVTSGIVSTTTVQASYKACTVTVYNHGTVVLSTIYSDNNNPATPLANPFTANTNGLWAFYANDGTYDVVLSGGGIPSPITLSAIQTFDFAAGTTPWTALNLNHILFAPNYAPTSSDFGNQVNAALASSDCPATGCVIMGGAQGTVNFATQIAPTKQFILIPGGNGGFANAGGHSIVTLNWTGGAVAPILLTGSGCSGSILRGFNLNNSGTATVGIDIDNFCNNVRLADITMDTPTSPFSVAGVRVGATANINDFRTDNLFIRAAAPWGIIYNQCFGQCRDYSSRFTHNTTGDVKVGGTGGSDETLDLKLFGTIIEGAQGVTPMVVLQAQDVACIGCYFEFGGGVPAVSFPNTATNVLDKIAFSHTRFACVWTNVTVDSVINSASTLTRLDAQSNLVTQNAGCLANPWYLVKNPSGQLFNVNWNGLEVTGGVSVSSTTNTNRMGNDLTGTPETQNDLQGALDIHGQAVVGNTTTFEHVVDGGSTNGRQWTFGNASISSLQDSIGSAFSSGNAFMAFNARQTANSTDNWAQGSNANNSLRIALDSANGFLFNVATAGTVPGTNAAFWGATSQFRVDTSGNGYFHSGGTIIYRCTVAGTLRVGQLTSVQGDCGAAVDSGLRTP